MSSPLPWLAAQLRHWPSCEARAPAPRYFYCLGTRLRKGVACFYFFFPSLSLFDQIQENSGVGLHFGAAQWALLFRQLQTVHRATEMLLIVLVPSNCHFSQPLMVLKMNASGSLDQRMGEPWGALASQLPQEGAAAGCLKQAGTSQPEASWHTLGAPEHVAGQYIERVKKNNNISGSSPGYCREDA